MTQRILVLISGRGSNLAALHRALLPQQGPGHEAAEAVIQGVISNRADAPGLQWAREQGLSTQVLDHRAYSTREAFDHALLQACQALAPDLVVLAGFMRVLGADFVRSYEGRLLNIHPSLLPAFAGLHTHRRALQAGVKWAGATVHYVTAELDHGPVVAQAVVPVRPDDDEASLAARVLQAEHQLLPLAVRWHVQGDLEIRHGVVRHRKGLSQSLMLG